MPRRLITLLVALGAAACVWAGTAAAAPVRAHAAAGGITISAFAHSGQGGHSPRLTITRNQQVVYDKRVGSRACGSSCAFSNTFPGGKPVDLVDLDANGEPEVVVALYSGGAHCCFIDQVFTYDAARNTYAATEHNFLDAGAVIKQMGKRLVFMSADARIADNSFTDFADSGAPLQIWRFAHRRFTDITRQFPGLLRADAAKWLRAFNRHIRNGVGFLAAWAADEDLLGRSRQVSATLASEVRRGRVHSTLGLPHNSAQEFVTELKKFLRRLGYTR